jgi:predicted GIY-YIG superfamily endonuclease
VTERTALYRFFDHADVLMYVGVTTSFGRRWTEHAKVKAWYPQVHHQTVTWFDSRQAALDAEAIAIREECPLHNISQSPWRLVPTATGGVALAPKPKPEDKHRIKAKAFRPEPDEYDDGMELLDERGWEMDGFLRACLRLLREEPERLLSLLAPHRPPPKPRGRPRKGQD